MLTRRNFLQAIPSAVLLASARADATPAYGRIDTHIHIHRDAPVLVSSLKAANWRGLDIVVSPASADESFDLEEKLDATRKVARDSGGAVAWASTFDARGFERPDFTERTIARVRRAFDDGAIGVKIWKNIGMSIKAKSGGVPAARRSFPLADLRGDRAGRPNAGRPPRRTERGLAAARFQESGIDVLFQ